MEVDSRDVKRAEAILKDSHFPFKIKDKYIFSTNLIQRKILAGKGINFCQKRTDKDE